MKKILTIIFISFVLGISLIAIFSSEEKVMERNKNYIKKQLEQAENKKLRNEQKYINALSEYRKSIIEYYLADIKNYKHCLEEESFKFRSNGQLDEDRYTRCRDYLKTEYGLSEEEIGYYVPQDLFYTFLKGENVYVTQTHDEHVANNGLKAVGIGTGGQPLTQYAPDLYNKEVLWEIVYCDFPDSLGKCLELKTKTDKFKIGHIRDYLVEEGQFVKTGTPVAITGGTESDEGVSTGYHAHIEYYTYNQAKAEADLEPWNIQEYTFKNTDLHERGVFVQKAVEEPIIQSLNNEVNGWDVLKPGDDKIKPHNSIVYQGHDTPAEILSCVHLRESGRQIIQPKISSAGAVGPMQFLPCTWYNQGEDVRNPNTCNTSINPNQFEVPYSRGYAIDANGNGVANANELEDAVASASKKLHENYIKKGNWRDSLLVYNNAGWYADFVLQCSQVVKNNS